MFWTYFGLVFDNFDSFLLRFAHQMRVGLKCLRYGGMTQPFRHCDDVRAIVQQEGRVAVPEVMDPDRVDTGQPDAFTEGAVDRGDGKRRDSAEDKRVSLPDPGIDDLHGVGVDSDGALAAVRLEWLEAVLEVLHAPVDVHLVSFETVSRQGNRFATAAACPVQERKERADHWILDRFSEQLELLGSPYFHFGLICFGKLERLQHHSGVLPTIHAVVEAEDAPDVLQATVHGSRCQSAVFEAVPPLYKVGFGYLLDRNIYVVGEVCRDPRFLFGSCAERGVVIVEHALEDVPEGGGRSGSHLLNFCICLPLHSLSARLEATLPDLFPFSGQFIVSVKTGRVRPVCVLIDRHN